MPPSKKNPPAPAIWSTTNDHDLAERPPLAGLRVAIVVADELSFERMRTHLLPAHHDKRAVHWLIHYEAARDALLRDAYDVAILDSRHHGFALVSDVTDGVARTPMVLVIDGVAGDHAAAAPACTLLERKLMSSAQLHHAIREATDRAATHSPAWWRSAGQTVSHAVDFPPEPAPHGNFFFDAGTHKRHEKLRADVLRHVPAIFGRIDASGCIREIDGAGLKRQGLELSHLHGAHFLAVFPKGRDALERAVAGEVARFETCVTTRTEKPWQAEFDLVREAESSPEVVFFGREVPLQRGLEGQLLVALDAERHRIGADLHDDVGQLLTGISCLSTALVARLRGRNDAAAADANIIADVAREALAQIRSLAHGLAPVRLARDGLTNALGELQTRVRRMHAVDLRLHLQPGRNCLGSETTAHLFHIVQEAIANAIRHGQAKTIDVSLQPTDDRLRLVITDDGRGFDPAAPRGVAGSGLGLMDYRTTLIGGVLTVTSDHANGTRIEVSFTPLEPCPHENAS